MSLANPMLALGAVELRDRMASGALRAQELAEACLEQIARQEPAVQAWTWLDGEHVLNQAKALDDLRQSGRAIGPLHGLPVGIKDIINTAGIPTENGTPIDAGRVPREDAYVITRLREAGAIIMGKTVTAELAHYHPGKTRNPHNPQHTPGGSSSGSAAAVAAGMVPLSLGTQTGGSVIRPAAFCGVVGFKPTFGAIPRTGILSVAPSLDTVGVFARDVSGAALIAEALCGYDANDPATAPKAPTRLLATASERVPVRPSLAFVRQASWDTADDDTKAAFDELTAALGDACEEIELPSAFNEAGRLREVVQKAEMAKALYRYDHRGRDLLSESMRQGIDDGRRILAHDYLSARDWPGVLTAGLDAVFARYDAIVTPAAPGPAPLGLQSTGSPSFNGLWTFCGTPAVTLPLLQASNGLPMGVQLVGRPGEDGRLLRTALWLTETLQRAS